MIMLLFLVHMTTIECNYPRYIREQLNNMNLDNKNCNACHSEVISTLNTEVSSLKSKVEQMKKIQDKNTTKINQVVTELNNYKKELLKDEALINKMMKPQEP